MSYQFWFKEREGLESFFKWYNYRMGNLVWEVVVRISAVTASMFFIAQERSRLLPATDSVVERYIDFLEFMFIIGLLANVLQIVLPCMARTYEWLKLELPSAVASVCSFAIGLLMTVAVDELILSFVADVYVAIMAAGQL